MDTWAAEECRTHKDTALVQVGGEGLHLPEWKVGEGLYEVRVSIHESLKRTTKRAVSWKYAIKATRLLLLRERAQGRALNTDCCCRERGELSLQEDSKSQVSVLGAKA